jgi:phospholipid/cholesterol/gamma-HCH transport system ATP-binding protein
MKISERPHFESLRFEKATFAYEHKGVIGAGAEKTEIIKNVSFEFPLQKLLWIQSENANGKSTLMQLLAGIILPTNGNYYINNVCITEMSFEDFLPYRLNIGYGFDQGGLLHNRTIEENILLPIFYHKLMPARDAKDRAHHYMEKMKILDSKDLRPSYVRGRVRKIACLIRAIIHHPDLLLLDDPTMGLDEELSLVFAQIIDDLKNNNEIKTIYISSFDKKFMSCFKNYAEEKIVIGHNSLEMISSGDNAKSVVGL